MLTAILLVIFIGGLPIRFDDLSQACLSQPCPPQTLTPPEVEALTELGVPLVVYASFHNVLEILVAIIYTLLAALIVWRRRDWMGVLVATIFVLFGLSFMVEEDGALLRHFPDLRTPFLLLTSLASVSFILMFYLFPSGRFVPRWTRYAALIMVALALLDPWLQAQGLTTPTADLSPVLLFAILVNLVIGVYAQVHRYRYEADAAERQQTKWIVFGLAGLMLIAVIYSLFVEIFPLPPGRARLAFNTIGFGFLSLFLVFFFPFSVAFSILRYRLWDIDIVINRALVYGLLTGALLLVYFGSVVVLQSLVQALTGQTSSPLVTVISTLAIAALFNPLRHRLQEFIDRRFYRRKYDAEQTLARFARTARDEVDLDQLTAELAQVVDETMQPEYVTMWLRER